MKKILSIVVMVLLGVTSVWAEQYSVTKYNYKADGADADKYVANFNTLHSTYVTMSNSDNASYKEEGYIRPSGGENGLQTGYIQMTAANNTYVNKFEAILGGSNHADGKPVALRWHAAPEGTAGLFSAGWNEGKYDYITSGADIAVELLNYNQKELKVYTGSTKTTLGKSNYAHLQDVSTTIWVPEVLTDETSTKQTAPNKKSMERVESAGESTEIPIEYKVQHGVKKEDFVAEIKNFAGKGELTSTIKELRGAGTENGVLVVICTYTADSGVGFATDYTADLVISSVNGVNNQSFTTKINGSAGSIATTLLEWNLSAPYYVNTTIYNPTTTNNDISPIVYESSNENVAYFSEGKLILKSDGETTLSAYQKSCPGFTESHCEDITIQVEKRTPQFTINPEGDLYTSVSYDKYITPANDPNNTMHPKYKSMDEMLFTIDEYGNLTTLAGLGTDTLQAEVETTDEWKGGTYEFPVNIVRDPIHVPLCFSEDLFNNLRFNLGKDGAAAFSWDNGQLKMGGSHDKTRVTGNIIFHLTGAPDTLTIDGITTTGTIHSITIEQSKDNVNWSSVGTISGAGNGFEFQLSPETKYLKISFDGVHYSYLTGFCITERVGFDVDPENISLLKLPSGDVASSIFIATISNLLEVQATIEGANAGDFELQDVGAYDSGSNTWIIDYHDGLGIDRTVKVPVTVGYKGDLNATDLLQKTCTVKLVGGDDTKYVAVKIEELTNNEDGLPNIIIATTADETGMQTGTDIANFSSDFKTENIVKTKDVKLANTFDENGMALFDEIYVFGKTVLADGATTFTKASTTATNNAVTPCYVYHKGGDGRRYNFYQKIDNVNQATKQLPNTTERCWTIAAGGNKKFYFTGFCPFGSNGASKDDEGIIYIKGAAGAKVDVYLEDCQLYSRQHTPYGDAKSKESVDMPTFPISINITGAIGGGAASSAQAAGSASAIVFECTNDFNRENPFRPTIHTIGDNVLYSQLGCTGLASFAGEEKRIGQYCASLQVRVTEDSKDSYTVLSFDDKWPTDATDMAAYRRTNGYIRFQKSAGNSPSIELGNENTILNFNGGQIELQNSVPGAQYYLNTLAICCRLGYAVWNNMTLFVGYGLGQDEVGGEVNFNDGTVNALPARITTDAYKPYFDLDANGNTTTLRCPQKTYITGGSHNSDVRACAAVDMTGGSPKDKKGNTLVKLDYQLPGEAGISVDTNTNLVIPNTMPVTLTCVGCGENGANTTLDLEHYGKESLFPDKDQYIHLWAPGAGRVEYSITSWVLSMTKVVGDYQGMHSVEIGGLVEVPASNTDKVNNLLYAQIDDKMFEVLGASNPAYKIPGKVNEYMYADVKKYGDKTYDNITNADPYTIHEKIYYVRVVNADEWIMFAPPFDISNVYVLETSSETDLENLTQTLTRDEALKKQAGYNMDFASIFAAEIMKDMESNLNGTFNSHYDAYRVYASDLSNKQGKNYSADVKKIQIHPFTGSNYNANFFLYKSKTNEWAYSDGAFATDWEIISPVPVTKKIGDVNRKVIMEKDNIYALQFPFCPRCEYDPETGEIGDRDYWDYWTGKFIIFEGYGPQTIDGTNKSATIEGLDYTVKNSGHLRGNPVFAEYMVSSEKALFFDSYYDKYFGGDKFGDEEDLMRTQKAGGVYMVANLPAPSLLPGRVKSVDPETGDVHFESSGTNGDNTTTSTPTISGNRQMLVYTIEGGVGVIPIIAQQVSLYNAAGQLITSQYLTEEIQISLPAGIYLICGKNEMAKVIVR